MVVINIKSSLDRVVLILEKGSFISSGTVRKGGRIGQLSSSPIIPSSIKGLRSFTVKRILGSITGKFY